MRILFWSELFWPYIGGPEVMAVRLLPALRELGYDLTVVTSQGQHELPARAEYQGIPIHRLPFRSAIAQGDVEGLIRASRQVRELKRMLAPDIVHLYGIGTSALFHLRTPSLPPPALLITMQTRLLNEEVGQETLQGRVLAAADRVVACSASIARQLSRLLPEVAERTAVIPNAVELPAEAPRPLPTDPPRILCLGRLIPLKGFDLAIEALASIRDRFPAACMTIAGEGPARSALERLAKDLDLDSRIDFRGWVSPSGVPALINEATLVLLPSRGREGLPVTAIQAALMGRPLITTRVGGLTEALVDGVTGLHVEEDDRIGLGEAIARLLSHPAQAAEMGRAARVRALETFSWDAHVEAYDAVYRDLPRVESPA